MDEVERVLQRVVDCRELILSTTPEHAHGRIKEMLESAARSRSAFSTSNKGTLISSPTRTPRWDSDLEY
jgi:hypothetical protein